MGNSVPKGERVVEVFNCELDCGDYVVVSLLPKQVISSERRTGDEGEGSERPLEESIDSGYEEPNQCIRSDQQHGKIEESCKSERCQLGEHRSYYGYRHYQYSEDDCEGNRHITDEDL